MYSVRDMVRHPSRIFGDASDEIAYRTRKMARRPYATGGLIMLILGVVTFIWLFPEIQRYIRIKRM
ncbi:MAG: hypothetical protein JWP03_2364 [Phycisphaerales bacterium]|nr:hypothetical protein [Phycisphaerales bacterium]